MIRKGVVVDFDFVVADGAELLFRTACGFLKALDGIALDERVESQYFLGREYKEGFGAYFQVVRTKKTAAKSARDFSSAFRTALDGAIPGSLTLGFKKFLKILDERGVRVVLLTRSHLPEVAATFAPIISDNVVLYHESSTTYGNLRREAWFRACVAYDLKASSTVAVTGSGLGVKEALFAGMPSLAVVRDRVAYQDFCGADEMVSELNGPAARLVLGMLRMDG